MTCFEKAWTGFCLAEYTVTLAGDESSVLRYLGWLYSKDKVSGASNENYISTIASSHSCVGLELKATPLLPVAMTA